MKYQFAIFCNGIKIQSGKIEADTVKDAYERFIYKCLDKIEEPSRGTSEETTKGKDIFDILGIKRQP